ncbi:hypothetical protein V8F33_012765 [Rhypophila sp. PSN 637]
MLPFYLVIHILFLALGVAANPLSGRISPRPTKKPCTTYVTKIIGGAYIPETVYTVYTTTETVFSLVPCRGCVLATTTLYAPAPPPGGAGWPWGGTTTTITASGPYNTTSTICSPSQRPHYTPITARDEDPAKLTITQSTAGECTPGAYTITTTAETANKPGITLPDPGRTNPIEPTTFAVFKARDTPPPVTTITISSKSWSATTTTTKWTTCFLGPYQDPDPGAIPKRETEAAECVTPPRPTGTAYKTIVIPETGTLTRTTVKCTKTVLTRRPKPTFTLEVDAN